MITLDRNVAKVKQVLQLMRVIAVNKEDAQGKQDGCNLFPHEHCSYSLPEAPSPAELFAESL